MTQIGSYIGDIVHSYNMQLKLLFMFITITEMFQLIKQKMHTVIKLKYFSVSLIWRFLNLKIWHFPFWRFYHLIAI